MVTELNDPEGASSTPQRYVVTVAFDLLPAARDRFLQLVKANAAASVALEPDCLRFDVMTPVADGGPDVFLYEIYETRQAFERHQTMPHFLRFDAETRDLVTRKTVRAFDVFEHAK